jgi:choline dehydrogenase-like flavoprotein
MPFIDANAHLSDGNWSGFDATVIGAGAAGIFLAVSLARRGKRVLLLETGHFVHDPSRQELNDLEQTAKPLANAIWNRRRMIGGTTTLWGGQSLPFTEIDFARRDWLPVSGWPIDYQQLRPYYHVANRFMGIDELNYDTDLFAQFGQRDLGLSPHLLRYHYSKWARQPNFFKLHGRELKQRVTLLYNAQLRRINLGENGAVASIDVSNFAGGRKDLPVRTLILATGGIETNRILLLNDHQHAAGLGGESGWLGKAFMEHPCIQAGEIVARDDRALQSSFGTRLRHWRRFSVRLSASTEWQEKNQLLNVSAALMWLYEGNAVGPLTELRRVLARPSLSGIPAMMKNAGKAAGSIMPLLRQGLIYKPGAFARISLTSEQEPTRQSYVALSDRCDEFGDRKARLHWKVSRRSWETIVRFVDVLELEAKRTGLGQVRRAPALRFDAPDWESQLSDVNHHMGGARMSATAADGVVDRNLQVWRAANLYVASAAVFPTSSHSNPTLTLLALAARLVDKLSR